MIDHTTHDTSNEIPYGYCHCGCGQKTSIIPYTARTVGLVKGEPRKFIVGHQNRCDLSYTIDSDTQCWNWNGHTNQLGYGIFVRDGERWTAHRYYYEKLVGPIPADHDLHHLCHNRRCVNPAHVQPLTRKAHLALHPQTALTDDDKAEIRRLKGSVKQTDLAARYNVHPRTIQLLWRGTPRRRYTAKKITVCDNI